MDLDQLVNDLLEATGGIFSQMEIAEEEIEAAQKRHDEPVGEKGPIWKSFLLLKPTHPLMSTEFMYRQHCREILDRRAADLDTTAATGAELVIAVSETSQLAPLTGWGAGLYFKLLRQYFPAQASEVFKDFDRTVDDYKRMYGDRMIETELELRRKMRQDWRVPERKEDNG